MKADPTDQLRLLELQALDTRLDQIAHARATLPEVAALTSLGQDSAALDRELALARTAVADVQREVAKAEADVQQVRDRAERNQKRLDIGTGTAKDLQALQHELVSLARRQSELEDLEIEVMERAEELEQQLAALVSRRATLDEEMAAISARRDVAMAGFDAEAQQISADRAAVTPSVADALLSLYSKIREAGGGIGAAELRQRRCGGCRLELNQLDLSSIRAAAPDEVVRCEECRRILVRTPESGL
ncbi:MAG: C4-type zinc ribbon domain-containing protein [Dermatophilaceae bacterium]